MKAVNIELTKWQSEILKPMFDVIHEAFDDGKPQAIFAQIWGNATKDGLAVMEVRIIDGEKCRKIQSTTGVPKGTFPDGKPKDLTFLTPRRIMPVDYKKYPENSDEETE